jgi:hypothetical protein
LSPSIIHQNLFVLIKFLSTSHGSHQLPFNFLSFPIQPYINPHRALNFGIKFFFATWKLGSQDDSNGDKDQKNKKVIAKKFKN